MEKPEYKITYGMPRVLYQVIIAYDSSYTSIVYIYTLNTIVRIYWEL